MDFENIAYAHGKLRKGLLAHVQSTMVSKHIDHERSSFFIQRGGRKSETMQINGKKEERLGREYVLSISVTQKENKRRFAVYKTQSNSGWSVKWCKNSKMKSKQRNDIPKA